MPGHPADHAPKPSTPPGSGVDKDPALQGEGNYSAARRHRRSVERFVAAGKVDGAARAAAPGSPEEARDLEAAEQAGRAHARK